MTEPVRLLQDENSPEARILLAAGLGETAPQGASRRALVGLGLATGTTASPAAPSSTGSPGGAADTGASSLGGATATGAVSLTRVLKWMGGGVIGALLIAQAIPGGHQPAVSKPTSPASSNRGTTFTTSAPRLVPRAPATAEPTAWVTEKAPLPTPSRSSAPSQMPRALRRVGAPPAADSLAAEVALLDEARAALARGEPTRALRLTERHQREYPAGRLAPEAFILKLTALVRAGEVGRARAISDAWLATHPSGPQADRVREIVGE